MLLALAGCQDDISTEFPDGLGPFDDDSVPETLDDAGMEQLVTTSTDTDMIRAYGRGLVFAPPAAVWAAGQDPQVMIAKCQTTSQGIMFGNEPQYELSFLVHYFVDDIVNVEWDDQWRGGVIEGTADAPTLAIWRHQKIQGSDFIDLSEGTVELYATPDPNVTELRFVEHLEATSASASDVVAGTVDNYRALRAVAHGDPIPACAR